MKSLNSIRKWPASLPKSSFACAKRAKNAFRRRKHCLQGAIWKDIGAVNLHEQDRGLPLDDPYWKCDNAGMQFLTHHKLLFQVCLFVYFQIGSNEDQHHMLSSLTSHCFGQSTSLCDNHKIEALCMQQLTETINSSVLFTEPVKRLVQPLEKARGLWQRSWLQGLTLIPFLWVPFLGNALVEMLLYVWSRNFPTAQVQLFGLVPVQAFYLPFVYVGLTLVLGGNWVNGILGILSGHVWVT